jgi:glycosyltransferase involved in cell wall biosynthesis
MRIIHTVSSVEQEASGPSYSVVRLSQALARIVDDVHLLSVGNTASGGTGNYRHSTCRKSFGGVPGVRRLFVSSDLLRLLYREAGKAQLIHSHGLWLMPNVYPAWAASRHGRPLVVSPRGTLSPVALRFSPHLKKLFWALLQGPAIRSAACLHATSDQEYEHIRNAGLRQPVAIVSNGIDIHPLHASEARPELRTLLYLGRLHPIKGLENLLRAWQRVAGEFREWQLRLVGPDEGDYRSKLERLAHELRLERTAFAGPRYGEAKQAEYDAADLFVLPSYSENFGVSVAEALARGVPVIATTGTPWQKLRDQGCGWLVAPDVEGLEGALRQALALDPTSLKTMGRGGRAWVEHQFSWPRVAADFERAYRWLLSGGTAPEFVKLD